MVVEATGSPDGFAAAVAHTKPRGTLILKSTFAGDVQFNLAPIVIDEITLIGSRCGRFAPALDLLRRGSIQVAPMIDCTYPIDEALKAFERAQAPGVLKVLLEMGG